MTTLEKLKEKVEELETLYAELAGGGASSTELNRIWTKIKELQRQIAFIESTQNNSTEAFRQRRFFIEHF